MSTFIDAETFKCYEKKRSFAKCSTSNFAQPSLVYNRRQVSPPIALVNNFSSLYFISTYPMCKAGKKCDLHTKRSIPPSANSARRSFNTQRRGDLVSVRKAGAHHQISQFPHARNQTLIGTGCGTPKNHKKNWFSWEGCTGNNLKKASCSEKAHTDMSLSLRSRPCALHQGVMTEIISHFPIRRR